MSCEINPAKKASPAPVVSIILHALVISVVPWKPFINHEIGFAPSVIITSGWFNIFSDISEGLSFSKNKIARIQYLDNCNFNIVYDNLNAKIFFSSININNNFPYIIKVFDERTVENSANVTEVKVSEYTDDQILVYSRMFTYVGNAPSNVQFYLTDSTSNFLAGSLFFNTEPNYDSLLPYINYIRADVRKLIENFEWNKWQTIIKSGFFYWYFL